MGGKKERRLRTVRLGLAFALTALIAGVAPMLATSSPDGRVPAKIDGTVLEQLATKGTAAFVIYLKDQADVSAAHEMRDQNARGWFVYRTLKSHAARTQGPIRDLLEARGVSYRAFWAANVITAQGDRSLIEGLAARSDVAKIESNAESNWIDGTDRSRNLDRPDVVEWGVARVNAPQLWALGFTGQGIVIANQDTGVRWTHNALKPKYRGWNGSSADHNYNWWDAIHTGGGICGPNRQEPCDDDSHGSHTTGTTSGDDGSGNQIGVAPGAKWIGCRNMDQGNGTPATYTECFSFHLWQP